jgi:hypothetical protein
MASVAARFLTGGNLFILASAPFEFYRGSAASRDLASGDIRLENMNQFNLSAIVPPVPVQLRDRKADPAIRPECITLPELAIKTV